ncbi:hypothetical protein Lalb_Chr23g0278161 [Lupinus albus]|uniref:Uncharacterized protein n=1 Tax=Lupinus albus TaxID=3870 RepID=A0A6A4NJX4_LUPAL|nr:hypothetical protein Lalb_Chr23g0278161 [Lupinus albus]
MDVDEVLLQNEWNHAEVYIDIYSTWGPTFVAMQTGLHVFKQKNSMEDIQFTDPYHRDDDRDSNSTTNVKVRYVGVR